VACPDLGGGHNLMLWRARLEESSLPCFLAHRSMALRRPTPAAAGKHSRWFREVFGLAGESVDVTPSHAKKVGDLCIVEEVIGHQTEPAHRRSARPTVGMREARAG
jgi:hypothetical protein